MLHEDVRSLLGGLLQPSTSQQHSSSSKITDENAKATEPVSISEKSEASNASNSAAKPSSTWSQVAKASASALTLETRAVLLTCEGPLVTSSLLEKPEPLVTSSSLDPSTSSTAAGSSEERAVMIPSELDIEELINDIQIEFTRTEPQLSEEDKEEVYAGLEAMLEVQEKLPRIQMTPFVALETIAAAERLLHQLKAVE